MRRSALALLLLAPAAALGGASFTESDLYFQAGPTERTAMEISDELHGEDIRLNHEDGGVTGELIGTSVDLHAEGGRVHGTIGGQPVELRVADAGGTIAYEGDAGDEHVSGIVSPQMLSVGFGQCLAALGLTGRAYEGMINCGADSRQLAIAFPTALSDASIEQQVALVVALVWTARETAG